MNDFEKAYYEAEGFWVGNMVQDEANMKRIELTASYIRKDVKSLADIGCGNGVFLHYVANQFPYLDLLGVDRSSTALKFLRTKKLEAGIDQIPLSDKSVDCVSCLEVIEHLPLNVYEKGLDEITRISKKYIIISVPFKEILEHSHNKCPSCTSIFNYELHLRSFDVKVMTELLETRGFKCTDYCTTGTGVSYRGHRAYQKIFYPEQTQKWNSPICPICGYSEKDFKTIDLNSISGASEVRKPNSRKMISFLSYLPKLFWPKVLKDYWLIVHYERL
ncbi:MAG: class I SAM-dependent methyltransferase [Saprospiraceae bacterium]|nr:class I SAM-dependent methyltransferase [Saprospiraceae bacterium]